jgi:hypothetical protein
VTGRSQRQAARLRNWAFGLALTALGTNSAQAEPPKRELPNYAGREQSTDAGDVLLWVPRILLSPLYVVSEFVLRRPLGYLVSSAERAQVPSALYDLFTFGPDHRAALLPVAFIDFGFEPSVGALFFWNDIAPHNDLSVRFSTWGIRWLAGNVTYTVRLPGDASFAMHFTGLRRPDYVYFGIGPNTLQGDRSRYGSSRLEGGFDGELAGARIVRLKLGLGVRSVSFHESDFHDQIDLQEAANEGRYPLPPGYETGYTVLYNRLLFTVDSRKDSALRDSGVLFDVSVEQHSDVRRSPGSGYLRYGAWLGGFYDLNDHGRVVSLAFGAQFADPLGHEPVPFTELVTLGGSGPMRGFVPGRLVDRSAAAATLRYRWPIWAFLDGSLQFSVGNVFGPHLEGFKASLLRFSGALGFESGKVDKSLEFLLGLGSETFEHGGQITSFRVVIGSNHGF